MSKIPSLPIEIKSWARCLTGCIFSCSRGNCIFFFQFPFWCILEYYKVGLCITAWRRGFGLRLFFHLSKRVSFCSRYGFFSSTFSYIVPFGVIENRVTKINSAILMKILTIHSFPGWSITFIYAPTHKGLAFCKKHIWARLSLS